MSSSPWLPARDIAAYFRTNVKSIGALVTAGLVERVAFGARLRRYRLTEKASKTGGAQ